MEDCYDAKSFLKIMFSHIGIREICYECPFRDKRKISDFTMGDFWEIGNYSKELDDNKGTTCLKVNTEKGIKFIGKLKNVEIVDVSYSYTNERKRKNFVKPLNRDYFFRDSNDMEYGNLMMKYFPRTKKDFIANNIKPILFLLPGSKRVIKYIKLRKIKK